MQLLEILIVITKPDLSQNSFLSLLKLVSPEKQDRIKRFHFYKDAQNTLVGDILVRSAICKRTSLRNEQLIFSANDYGKPFLVNDPHVHFNISHAGDYVIVAIDDEPVGIDVELIKPVDMKIADRFFTLDEKEYILTQQSDFWDRAFFVIWTKKESHIKWDGRGLSIPLPSFSVLSRQKGWPYYHCIFEDNEAICHVCSMKDTQPRFKQVDIPELLAYLLR